jgi:hypothetical protein
MVSETNEQESKVEVTIKIEGTATYSDKPTTDQVKALDEFVSELFKKHQDALQREFDAAGELSYEEQDEKSNEIIDPYLQSFSFDTVTKNVR